MTILETERLLLKESSLSDASFIFELLNTDTWKKYIGDRKIRKIEDAEAYIQNSLIKSYRENGYGLYTMLLKATNSPVGLCGLINRPSLEHTDIGFAVLPKHEGNGYTSEAAKATLQYGLKQLNLNPILGITSENNLGSQRVLEKIGLHFIKKTLLDGDKEECLLFSNNID